MALVWLIAIPAAGGLLAWLLGHWSSRWLRWISLIALFVDLLLALSIWVSQYAQPGAPTASPWLIEINEPWIPQIGISVHLALDGLSLLLILLTFLLGVMAVLASWTEVTDRVGFFHFVDDDQGALRLQAWSTNTVTRMCTAEGAGSHYPVDQAGVWADCVRTARPVVHNDYASLATRKELPPGHARVARELTVPVMRACLSISHCAADSSGPGTPCSWPRNVSGSPQCAAQPERRPLPPG